MSSARLIPVLPWLLAGAVAGSACSKAPASSASNATTAASPAVPPAMPAHEKRSPVPQDPAETATGTIVETMDAGGYTYVRLDTGTEQIWVATSPIAVKVGETLTVPLEMPMQNFHSAKLGRDFPLIYFASRVSRGGEPLPTEATGGMPPASGQTMPPGHPPVGAGAPASPTGVTEAIAPPAGGHTVADLWARRKALAGTTVVVRGKVVKALGGVMGRNWVHLQDGTGKAKDGTNDITVTTADEAKPGDIVTATGTLGIDKDFGAGYRYGAIVESATLSK